MYNLCTIFNVFLYKIKDLMNIGAELGQYLRASTHQKNSEDSIGGLNP